MSLDCSIILFCIGVKSCWTALLDGFMCRLFWELENWVAFGLQLPMAMDGLDAFVDSHQVVCFVLHVLGYYMNCASINIYIFSVNKWAWIITWRIKCTCQFALQRKLMNCEKKFLVLSTCTIDGSGVNWVSCRFSKQWRLTMLEFSADVGEVEFHKEFNMEIPDLEIGNEQ